MLLVNRVLVLSRSKDNSKKIVNSTSQISRSLGTAWPGSPGLNYPPDPLIFPKFSSPLHNFDNKHQLKNKPKSSGSFNYQHKNKPESLLITTTMARVPSPVLLSEIYSPSPSASPPPSNTRASNSSRPVKMAASKNVASVAAT